LIIERLLFDEEGEELDIYKIALKCSEQERISFRAETSVKTLKKLRLLQKWKDKDAEKEYEAIVTRIKPFGLFFEVPCLMLEGFLHISQLEDDYFTYDQQRNMLIGRSGHRIHKTGERLKVKAESINLIMLETKWILVTENPRQRGSEQISPKKPHRRKRK
jgi:ribonuclease R